VNRYGRSPPREPLFLRQVGLSAHVTQEDVTNVSVTKMEACKEDPSHRKPVRDCGKDDLVLLVMDPRPLLDKGKKTGLARARGMLVRLGYLC
jgi:hypothetical protein